VQRRIFILIVAVSLLLFTATTALWIRSLGHFEIVHMRYARWPQSEEPHGTYFSFSRYSNTLRAEVNRTHLMPAYFASHADPSSQGFRAIDPPGMHWYFAGDRTTRIMNSYDAGYAARHYAYTAPADTEDIWLLAVRPWPPTFLTAVLPMIWLIRFRQSRRARKKGLRPNCGYDLRATPHRCPECGAIPTNPG
jgi:hypothetical protein